LVSKVSGRCVRMVVPATMKQTGEKNQNKKKDFFKCVYNFLHFQFYRDRSTRDRLMTFCPITIVVLRAIYNYYNIIWYIYFFLITIIWLPMKPIVVSMCTNDYYLTDFGSFRKKNCLCERISNDGENYKNHMNLYS
jgi:hypothetical protein